MKDLRWIAVFALVVGLLPVVSHSGVFLNWLMMALFATLLSQAWNVLGGYAGQFSFGHAVFFGTGAYAQVLLQLNGGLNPWVALVGAVLISASLGAGLAAVSFRYGLKGSYFALVTLAFAEVFRILALSAGFTGGGVGLMLPLSESLGNMQFSSRAGYVWLILAWVVLALLVTAFLRQSRFGAYAQAVRDNEDAARALGVNPFAIKCWATVLSAALMGAGGAFYVQVFQYIDPNLVYGSHTSVAALVGAIVGGMGTLWGPVVGAMALELLAELTRNLFGELPGINLMVYGALLILIMVFLPRGLVGLKDRWSGQKKRQRSLLSAPHTEMAPVGLVPRGSQPVAVSGEMTPQGQGHNDAA